MKRGVPTLGSLQGSTLAGHYTIVRELGAGGMGAVYLATDRLGQSVVIKIPLETSDPKILARFQVEAQALANIRHPNVVRVLDYGEHDQRPFMAMEFLHGETLEARITRLGTLSPSAAVDLLLPVIGALSVIHEKGILHRDLKPANLFVARDDAGGERLVLIDFGIARLGDSVTGALTTTSAGPPATLAYCAPEKLERTPIGVGYDIFSLGAIMFEALTGEWFSPTGFALAVLLNQLTVDSLTQRNVPPGLVSAILRCLARYPADRFHSARALGDAMQPFASDFEGLRWQRFSSLPSAPSAPPREPSPTRDFSRTTPLSAAPVAPVMAPPALAHSTEVNPSLAQVLPSASPPQGRSPTLDSNQLAMVASARTPLPANPWPLRVGLAAAVLVLGSLLGVAVNRALVERPREPSHTARVSPQPLQIAPPPPITPPSPSRAVAPPLRAPVQVPVQGPVQAIAPAGTPVHPAARPQVAPGSNRSGHGPRQPRQPPVVPVYLNSSNGPSSVPRAQAGEFQSNPQGTPASVPSAHSGEFK